MSELAYIDFERQVETLPLVQLCRLRNKIDRLISHPETERNTSVLSPITARLLGVAQYDGDYDDLLQDSIGDKWL